MKVPDKHASDLSHLNSSGQVSMVDITEKKNSIRIASASAQVSMSPNTVQALLDRKVPKGDVFAAARIAGIQAAKKTPEIIPLCHQLNLTHCEINFELNPDQNTLFIVAQAKVASGTGVEMEALTAVTVAALTVYDMCKAIDPAMVILETKLVSKTGGKSDFASLEQS